MPFRKLKHVIGIIAFCAIYSVQATNSFTHNWYAQASLGATLQSTNGSTQIATDQPNNPDIYQINHLANSLALGIECGYQWQRNMKEKYIVRDNGQGILVVEHPHNVWFANYQVGLRYQHTLPAKLTGTVSQYAMPDFKNYDYHYSLSSQRLLLMGRTAIYSGKILSPFIEVGLGYEIDNVSNYSETALTDVTPRIAPNYSSTSSGGLSYLAGVGLKVQLNKQLWLSISDEFNQGATYKTGVDAATNTHLQNSVGSQVILLSLGYLFK